ncbi:MAG: hypothetical protein J0H53_05165 [Rhizobiales bacterium]|nr:hypothetical protein [Hyphomicrobiales bacterium]OJU35082.1 MAG: hypothetical protein BGN94_09005 [Rhizobiales bacterium 68-8]
MRLTLDLSESVVRALNGLAQFRRLTPEEIAAELLQTHLEAVGAIGGDVARRPPLRMARPEGNA